MKNLIFYLVVLSIASSVSSATNFLEPIKISGTLEGTIERVRVATNSQGQVAAVWDNTSTNQLYAAISTGKTWSEPTLIFSGSAEDISKLALNDNGQAAVSWYTDVGGNTNVYVSTLNSFSDSWSNSTLLSTGSTENISAEPALALNNSGQAAISWFSADDEDNLNVYISTVSSLGNTWSNPVLLSLNSVNNISASPQISMNSSGQIAVSWFTDNGDDENVYVSTLSSLCSIWSNPSLLSTGDTANISNTPQIALNNNGQIVVSWITTDSNIYVSTLDSFNSLWSDPTLISTGDTASISPNSQITLNKSQKAAIAWSTADGGSFNVYVATLSEFGNSWSSPALLSTGLTTNLSSGSKIGFNNSAQGAVTWSTNDNNVYISTINQLSNNWIGPIVLSTGITEDSASNPDLSLNTSGKIAIAFPASNSVYYVTGYIYDKASALQIHTKNTTFYPQKGLKSQAPAAQ